MKDKEDDLARDIAEHRAMSSAEAEEVISRSVASSAHGFRHVLSMIESLRRFVAAREP